MKNNYDVIVIGSGAIGSSISYHLSEEKEKEILTIDKGFPLSGASGSTQAWVWVHNKTPSWYGELSMYSAELYPILQKKIGDFEYKRTGGIIPFFSERDKKKAFDLAEEQAKVGINIEILNRDEVLKKEPTISPSVLGATYSNIDGNVNPFRLIDLYIRTAKKNGVHFSFYNPVTNICKINNNFKVVTEKGVFFAKQLVLASGPWSKHLGKFLNINIPVKQIRGQIIVTEPLSPFLSHTIGGIRQADNGEVLIGSSKEEVGYDKSSTLDIIQDTARMAIDIIPGLKEANMVRCFSGIRSVPEDGFPILGEIPDVENSYVAVMHSGITLSPIVGTLMKELLLGNSTSIDLERYNLKRFNN